MVKSHCSNFRIIAANLGVRIFRIFMVYEIIKNISSTYFQWEDTAVIPSCCVLCESRSPCDLHQSTTFDPDAPVSPRNDKTR